MATPATMNPALTPETGQAETPTITADRQATKILTDVGGLCLTKAIGVVERVDEVTRTVLRDLGAGTTSGLLLREAVTGAEKAQARTAIATALVDADQSLGKIAGGATPEARFAASCLAVSRIAGLIVEHELITEKPADTPTSGGPKGVTGECFMYANEEDRHHSDSTLDMSEVGKRRAALEAATGWKISSFLLCANQKIKRVSYWINVESVMPNPDFIALTSFVTGTESTDLAVRRMMVAALLAAVGKKHTRGDGTETEWLSARAVIDLFSTLDAAAVAPAAAACARRARQRA
jgi:hypothetical protein